MHSLLRRQLRRYFPNEGRFCEPWASLLEAVDTAYRESDRDRLMLERSLELSSHELLQANSDLRAILEAIPDLFFRTDRKGRILDCKGGSAEDFALPPGELVGRFIQDAPTAAAGGVFREAIERVYATRSPAVVEYELALRGGLEHYEARLLPVLDDELVVIVRNITQRCQASEAVARQRQFLGQVIDLNPNHIYATDRQGRFTLVNRAVADSYGLTVEELLGKTEAELNPTAGDEGQTQLDAEVLATCMERRVPEQRLTLGGATRWFHAVKRPILEAGGDAVQVLTVATDITERRRAEASLRERREQLFSQLSALHELALITHTDVPTVLQRIMEVACRVLGVERVGVWLMDDERTELVLKHACQSQGGASEVEQVSLQLADYPRYFAAFRESRTITAHDAFGDPRTSELAEDYLRASGITSLLDVSIRLNGRLAGVVCHEHVGVPRRWSPEEEHFASSIADLVAISLAAQERQALESQLRQSQKMEAVGLLAGGVAHDFNNLLTAIRGNCELLMLRETEHTAAREELSDIVKAAEQASAMTRKLLAFSRKQVLEPKVFELLACVQGMDSMLRRLLGEDIELQVTASTRNGRVEADPGQIEQVLLNLAVNAREAMPAGGRLTIEVDLVTVDSAYAQLHPGVKPGSYVLLVVSDTGTGMDEETQSRIFEPFFTTKGPGKGTGLGLSTVYGIVQQSGGHVHVYSELGGGTSFKVYLPHAKRERHEERWKGEKALECGHEVILLVEDNDLVRTLASKVLKQQGYTVLEAPNGPKAMGLCERHQGPIHLMLTDMVMPHMNGQELYERLAPDRPEIKVLFMSGYSEGAIVNHGVLVPGTAFLNKPFSATGLLTKVQEVLESAPVASFELAETR